MRYTSICTVLLFLFASSCQVVKFRTTAVKLPAELKEAENQFSGLYVQYGRLYFLPECRLQEKQEARLYSVALASLDSSLKDSSYLLPYQKHAIKGLNWVREKISAAGDVYEGLESLVMQGSSVYLSIETNTPSPNCYIIKGHFANEEVILDSNQLQTMRKPRKANGASIYNAGFEAVAIRNDKLHAFYEYNYFDGKNYLYNIDTLLSSAIDSTEIGPLPFRITDIVPTKKNHFTAINFFYKGGGKDSVYRIPKTDKEAKFIYPNDTTVSNFERLIDIHFTGKKYNWKPIWQMPEPWCSYNWEGLAAYKGGYFIINDKYMPTRPYYSTLIYVKHHKRR